jgi:YidC/Oxa1 family membrane protein insertase
MEKRVLLAVVLSYDVLYGYQALRPPPKPPQRAPAPAGPAAPQAESAATPPALEAVQPQTAPSTDAAAVVGDTQERDVRVENDAVSAIFSTRGGVLKSWRLKHYQDPAGQPLELVPQNVLPGTFRCFR